MRWLDRAAAKAGDRRGRTITTALLILAALVCGILAWSNFDAAAQVDAVHPHRGQDFGRLVDSIFCAATAVLLIVRLFVDTAPIEWLAAGGAGVVGLMLLRSMAVAIRDQIFAPHARRLHSAEWFPVILLAIAAGLSLLGTWAALA